MSDKHVMIQEFKDHQPQQSERNESPIKKEEIQK